LGKERKQASRLKEVADDYQFSKVAVYGLKFLEEIVFGCALRKPHFSVMKIVNEV